MGLITLLPSNRVDSGEHMAFESNGYLDVRASIEGFESNSYWQEITRKAAGERFESYVSPEYARLRVQEWDRFKSKIRPGDELWYYTSGMETYGIVLLRNGEVAEDFVISQV